MAGQGYRRNLTKIDPKGKGSESQQSLDYSTRDQSESGCTHCGEISWMNDNPSRKVRYFRTTPYVMAALKT